MGRRACLFPNRWMAELRRIGFLAATAVRAELQQTDVGDAKVIEGTAADLAVTGPSSEHLVGTAVAFARRIAESYSDDPIHDCEIAGSRAVSGNQLGLAAVGNALTAVVGQRYAIVAVGA